MAVSTSCGAVLQVSTHFWEIVDLSCGSAKQREIKLSDIKNRDAINDV
ncbi:MAG: hypothetical protein WCA84_13375 [Ignavibacteriaceae bacterium]